MKCIACDSGSLVGGIIFDSNGSKIYFQADDTPIWKSLFGAGKRGVRAYGCVNCGHLQLAVDFSEDDKQRYQRFEGEQPDVLERINSL